MAAPKGNQYAKGLTKENSNVGRPEKYSEEWLIEEAKALRDWIDQDKEFLDDKKIYLGNFAFERGYHRKRIAEFAEKSKEFSSAYEFAQNWQITKFIKNALSKKWDPGFTQYVMARVCSPEWRKSWDQPEEVKDTPTTVIINEIK